MRDLIFDGYEYGFDFLDGNGESVEEKVFSTIEECVALHDALDDPYHPAWPETAASVSETWQRAKYRHPVCGVDYGPGSIKRRFGGGYVPRSTYQYHGE